MEPLLQVQDGTVSRGWAAILAANVALPFAAAMAELLGAPELGQRALAVYARMPELPSNSLTRLMARQMGMARLPVGALAQQGLHHLWATACREKRCSQCLAGTFPGPPSARPEARSDEARPVQGLCRYRATQLCAEG